jgi:hypothetical protein
MAHNPDHTDEKFDPSKLNIYKHKIIVRFHSYLNLIWGKKINNREGFAFMRGFPATFFLMERRAVVVALFQEKMGWFHKPQIHQVCFEAGLDKLIDWKVTIDLKNKIKTAYLKFQPHGMLGEAEIQFLRMDPKIGYVMQEFLTNLKVKNPILDTGIVRFDYIPQQWLNERFALPK